MVQRIARCSRANDPRPYTRPRGPGRLCPGHCPGHPFGHCHDLLARSPSVAQHAVRSSALDSARLCSPPPRHRAGCLGRIPRRHERLSRARHLADPRRAGDSRRFARAASSGWIVGVMGFDDRSQIAADSCNVEVDAYTRLSPGRSRPIGTRRSTLTHYWYPNDPARTDYDYDEIPHRSRFAHNSSRPSPGRRRPKYFRLSGRRWHAARRRASRPTSYRHAADYAIARVHRRRRLQRSAALFEQATGIGTPESRTPMGPVQLDVSRIDSDHTAEHLFGSTLSERRLVRGDLMAFLRPPSPRQ